MEVYSKLGLQQLSIYELRSIARNVGVQSPTTKRHGELVECILKIQKGEVPAFSSKKGRPPKNINYASQTAEVNMAEGMPMEYQYAPNVSNDLIFCDDGYIDGVFIDTYPCHGIVRELNGKKYVYDYQSTRHFVFIEDERIPGFNLKVGDFVQGQATEINIKSALLCSVDDVNCSKQETILDKQSHKYSVVKFENSQKLFDDILNETTEIKVVLELEADDVSIVTLHDKCIYCHSGEYDDIKRSYNTILDCSKLIKILTQNNKPFTLYMVDIDYIFAILDAQFTSVKGRENIEAVQFLKDLLLNIKNANCGNIVIYETEKFKRNSYLQAIINKYLS